MSDMHSLLIAAILGVVEGLTEFLPVSSTGHMIIVGHLLGFEGDTAKTFEVVIQLGSILAVVVMFWLRRDTKNAKTGQRKHEKTIFRILCVKPPKSGGFLSMV